MNPTNKPSATPLALDLLTICAIGVVSFIVKNILHEGAGHGGVCLLVGGTPLYLSTAHFDCGVQLVSDNGVRLIAAGGTLMNFLAAFGFWVAFRHSTGWPASMRYFLWFCMSGNYFVAAGYPLFSGLIGVGDWIDVVQGYEPVWLWRMILTVVGFLLYIAGVWWTLQEMVVLIGSNPTERLKRAFTLTLFPYMAGATISSLGSFFNPIGMFVLFTSAAASFGGSSALAWMTQMYKTAWFPQKSDLFINIERQWGWVALAVLLALFHIFILGPSWQF